MEIFLYGKATEEPGKKATKTKKVIFVGDDTCINTGTLRVFFLLRRKMAMES